MAFTKLEPTGVNTSATFTFSNLIITGTLETQGNLNLGDAGNVKITGGTSGYVLSTDGSGNLSWVAQTGGGGTNYSNANVAAYLPTFTGDLTAGNINTTGNITAAYLIGNGSQLTGLPASYSNTNVASYLPTYTGNVSANYFIGNGSTLTNITGSNVIGEVGYAAVANSVAGSNVSGAVASATTAGTVTTNAQPNITSVGTLSSLTVNNDITANGTLVSTFSAGDEGGEIRLALSQTGTTLNTSVTIDVHQNRLRIFETGGTNRGGYFDITALAASVGTDLLAGGSGGYANSNVAAYLPTYTGNFTAGNISATGNTTSAYFIGNGSSLTNLNASNISSGTIPSSILGNSTHYIGTTSIALNRSSGSQTLTGVSIDGSASSATTAGTVTTAAQPNITSVGTLVDANISGNLFIGGNLTVNGATEYTNVTNLYVKDPIIEMGGNANAGALTSNDNKDRGTLLHYYTTKPVDAFMGWDNSASEFAFGSNVSMSGEIATFNEYGNIHAGNLIGNGQSLTGLNASNIASGTISSGILGNSTVYIGTTSIALNRSSGAQSLTGITSIDGYSATVSGAAQGNITSVGTLSSLTVSGLITATAGGIKVGNLQDTSGTNTVQLLNSNMSVTGNIVAGTSGIGNVTATNLSGNLLTAAQPNVTSVGSLSGLTVSNATGVVNFTTTANVTLGAVSNLHISGGTTGQYLQTDGSGGLSWATVSSGSTSNISNGTSNVNITTSGGNVTTSVNGNADVFVVTGTGANVNGYLTVSGALSTGGGSGGSLSGANVISANYFIGDGSQLTGLPASYANSNVALYLPTYSGVIGGTLSTTAQPNISSVGTLTSLTVSGLITATAGGIKVGNLQDTSGTNTVQLLNSNMSVTGNIVAGTGGSGNVTATYFIGNGSQLTGLPATYSNTNVASYLPTYTGVLTPSSLTVGTTANLGAIGNITITGGTSGQFLSTNGSGVLTWASASAGGGATITNDTATNSNAYYPVFTSTTSGTMSAANVSTTKLYFNPSTGTLNSTIFNSLSDKNYKTELVQISDALEKVKQLTGYVYTLTDSGERSAGLLSQDVNNVLPEAVRVNNGIQSLNYNATIGLLVESIKVLSDKIDLINQRLS